MSLLSAKTLDLADGKALDTDCVQGLLGFVQFEGLDDGFNFFHGLNLLWAKNVFNRGQNVRGRGWAHEVRGWGGSGGRSCHAALPSCVSILDHEVPLSPTREEATEVAATAAELRRCRFSKGPVLGATS